MPMGAPLIDTQAVAQTWACAIRWLLRLDTPASQLRFLHLARSASLPASCVH